MRFYHLLTCDSEDFYVEMPDGRYMEVNEYCREGGPAVSMGQLADFYDDIQHDFVTLAAIKALMSF